MSKRLAQRIKKWWDGTYVFNDNSNNYVTFLGYHDRHWTSRAAHAFHEFLKREWKWTIPVCLSAVSVAIALWRL